MQRDQKVKASMSGERSSRQAIIRQSRLLLCLGILVVALTSYAEPDKDESRQVHANAVREGQELFRELSQAIPQFVGLASAGFQLDTKVDPYTDLSSDCRESTGDESCWTSGQSDSRGQTWSYLLSPRSSLSIDGEFRCANRKLTGSGTATWRWVTRWELRIVRGEGRWRNGRPHGRWTYQLFSTPCIGFTNAQCKLSRESNNRLQDFEDGPPFQSHTVSTTVGRYKKGMRSGDWMVRFNNGDSASIPYANGRKHGLQTYTKTTFVSSLTNPLEDQYEIPWIDGKKQGRQVMKSWNGDREETPWQDGVIHGESNYIWATGERERVLWVHGRQHETSVFTWPDGSRLTTLYDDGIKVGYEVLRLAPQNGSDFVSLEARYQVKEETDGWHDSRWADRTVTRWVNGHKHGVKIYLRAPYRQRIYSSHWEGNTHGVHIVVQERPHGPDHEYSYEISRERALRFEDQEYGISVLVARNGYRREAPHNGGHHPHGSVIQLMANGSYRSHLQYESGREHGTSMRCWYDPIPWDREGMKGIHVFDWRDGVVGYYPWRFVEWHGPFSTVEPNGLCLQTPYVGGDKQGIEVQTQTNGYKAHLPMDRRWLKGVQLVFRPDGSRREIPYESGKKHGVVNEISAIGDKVPVEQYDSGVLVSPYEPTLPQSGSSVQKVD